VMVTGNEWAIVRARQSIESLLSADSLPAWLEKETVA
jgi:hypothetical protein